MTENPRDPGDRDGLPRMFPDPHPRAVASLGDAYVRFVEGMGTRLRWWQWLTAQRRYEVDAAGRWCWPRVWTSVPRQQGKSVELSRDGAWHGSLGRGALTLHAAYRVSTSRDVQAELWHWAQESGLSVARQLGDSRITWPDGSVWKTLAMESAYSQRPRRLLVDEAWAMQPAPFWNALWPALSGQDEPVQALFWSCANPEDRGLAADLRGDAEVCRMEWGAFPDEDFADPGVWRVCTPYWNPGREALMRPAADRPGFAENWLNVWPDGSARAGDEPLVSELLWVGAADVSVSVRPVVAAVEDRTGLGAAAAAAGVLPDGRVLVWGGKFRDRDAALAWVSVVSPAKLLLGASLASESLRGLRMESQLVGARETGQALPKFRELLASGRLVHDGGRDLAAQVLSVRVAERGGGLVVASRERSDLVRCAAWAVWSAAQAPARRVSWAIA